MHMNIRPSLSKGSRSFDHTVSFSGQSPLDTFLQDSNSPFMLTILSIHPEDMDSNALSVFTPEAQFNISIHSSFSDTDAGMDRNRNRSRMHQHNGFEFTYILNGHMYQIVEGKRYLYPAGSCCLMNRNTLHTEEISTDFTCIFFSISTDFIRRLDNYGNTMLFPEEQKQKQNLIFQFLMGNLDENHKDMKDFLDFIPLITETEQKIMVHDIFEKMIHILLNPEYGSTYHLLYLFLRLINILCDTNYYNVVHVTASSRSDSLLFARINRILEEQNGRISNQELSEMLNYNGTYLGKIVKKYTGKNLFQYRLTFTMEAAADLLKNTNLSISEIAARLLFSNRAHFYKLFKEYYGVTPKEYRGL